MRWLVALSLLLLAAALAYALWPSPAELPPPVAEAPPPAPVPAVAPSPRAAARPPPPLTAAPVAAAQPPPPPPAPTRPPPPPPEPSAGPGGAPGGLVAVPAEGEPEDAGVLHALTRAGIKGAIQEKLPEIKDCYEAWLAQNPRLGGKLKVDFRIAEVPGFERGRVTEVTVLDGGMGHVAMEGCVRNVFGELRFERPERGEMRVTYPLNFSPGADAGP